MRASVSRYIVPYMEKDTEGGEVLIFHIRVAADLAQRIDEIAAQMSQSVGDRVSRSAATRILLKRGLDDYERRIQ